MNLAPRPVREREHGMSQENDLRPVMNSARRRLLRGSFATPAVLTLHSGSVLAASSSRCTANQFTPEEIAVQSADDNLLRFNLWGLVKNSDPSKVREGKYYVPVTVSYLAQPPSDPSVTQWFEFDIALNQAGTTPVGAPSRANWTFKPTGLKFAVLRVDADGKVVGVGATGTGFLVSDSCASSLAGGALLNG